MAVRRRLPVPRHIQHVQLCGIGQLGGQPGQPVVPEGEHVEAGQAAQLTGDAAQAVPVHVQVGQLL